MNVDLVWLLDHHSIGFALGAIGVVNCEQMQSRVSEAVFQFVVVMLYRRRVSRTFSAFGVS
jgi:hypothetical protein